MWLIIIYLYLATAYSSNTNTCYECDDNKNCTGLYKDPNNGSFVYVNCDGCETNQSLHRSGYFNIANIYNCLNNSTVDCDCVYIAEMNTSGVTSEVTSEEVTSGVTSEEVTSEVTSEEVTSGVTSEEVTSGVTSEEVTSGVTSEVTITNHAITLTTNIIFMYLLILTSLYI